MKHWVWRILNAQLNLLGQPSISLNFAGNLSAAGVPRDRIESSIREIPGPPNLSRIAPSGEPSEKAGGNKLLRIWRRSPAPDRSGRAARRWSCPARCRLRCERAGDGYVRRTTFG